MGRNGGIKMKNECVNSTFDKISDGVENLSLTNVDIDKRIEEFDIYDEIDMTRFDPDGRVENLLKVDECLGKFEQTVWDSLDAVEITEAILDLRDALVEDLKLENSPEILYYFEDDSYDLGSYFPLDNSIYINCFQLDSPDNIAKTIVHEIRHCWQNERIAVPEELKTDFDKVLKFNDENYISPYDNYEAYWNQPMEIDARLYTDNILSTLFNN